jgi:hypothetical protein
MTTSNVSRLVPPVETQDAMVRCRIFRGATEEAVLTAAGRWVGDHRDTDHEVMIRGLTWWEDPDHEDELFVLRVHYTFVSD